MLGFFVPAVTFLLVCF